MRSILLCSLTPLLLVGFTGSVTAKTVLELSDPGLPLQEMRPLDRRVYVLSLDGKWTEPATPGVNYYVNFLFPGGASYSHRPTEEALFRQGEVRCVVQDYQLVRNGMAKSGHFTIVVSATRPVTSATAPEVVSNAVEITWPLDRPIVLYRPRTKFAEPAAIDTFALPGEPRPQEPVPPPRRDRTPPPPPPPGEGAPPPANPFKDAGTPGGGPAKAPAGTVPGTGQPGRPAPPPPVEKER